MESNKQLELARKIIEETDSSLFLTGKAGTGKTTFLHQLRTTSRKRMIVAAPTGIAAINAGGVTLHSFFQLDFGPYIPGIKRSGDRRSQSFRKEKIQIIRGLDLLVIDEVSMVRSDMLDAVDAVLRRYREHNLPFGGVQLLLIGDLQQLPPVVTEAERPLLATHYASPYFFDSHALQSLDYVTLELEKVYRQSDRDFLEMLNAVRDNKADAETLRRLNERHIPDFNPADSEGYVRLTTHNRFADKINAERMECLAGPSYIYDAKIQGNFPESSYPADPHLELRKGAQVMFIKNDVGAERRFFNGMLGQVTDLDNEKVVVTTVDTGDEIVVTPMLWENLTYKVNEQSKEIEEKIDGTYSQMPLKPAWAITIHKSQGLTFDRAIIDVDMSFTHGQTYVALSRCRTLAGMVLERPIPASAIITDSTVTNFLKSHRDMNLDEEKIETLSQAYQMRTIEGLFNLRSTFGLLEGLRRILKESFIKTYPDQVSKFDLTTQEMERSLNDIGDRFRVQLQRIYIGSGYNHRDSHLLQRVKDACAYFRDKIKEMLELTEALPGDHDSSKTLQKYKERLELLVGSLIVRHTLYKTFAYDDFDIEQYYEVKAEGTFQAGEQRKKKKATKSSALQQTDDNLHPELFEALRQWRLEKARELEVPAFVVGSTQLLLSISNTLPASYDELRAIRGMGPTKMRLYADTILDIVDSHRAKIKAEKSSKKEGTEK